MASINWKNHFIEFLAVLAGITIAFMLDSWRENSAKDELRKEYLESLKAEVEENISAVDSIIMKIAKDTISLSNLKKDLVNENYRSNEVYKSFTYLAKIYYYRPIKTIYEALKSSGDLTLIRDIALKKKIAEFYLSYENLEKILEIHIKYSDTYIVPYLLQVYNPIKNKLIKKDFMKSNEFANIITGSLMLLKQNLTIYKKNKELGENLIKSLGNAI